MRVLLASMMLLAASALLLSGGVEGGEKKGKQVTVKGTVTCAKCDLGKESKCMTVIVDSKDKAVYYFDPAGHKKHHGKVCTTPTEGSVTGTVKTEGEKKIITVKDVKLQ